MKDENRWAARLASIRNFFAGRGKLMTYAVTSNGMIAFLIFYALYHIDSIWVLIASAVMSTMFTFSTQLDVYYDLRSVCHPFSAPRISLERKENGTVIKEKFRKQEAWPELIDVSKSLWLYFTAQLWFLFSLGTAFLAGMLAFDIELVTRSSGRIVDKKDAIGRATEIFLWGVNGNITLFATLFMCVTFYFLMSRKPFIKMIEHQAAENLHLKRLRARRRMVLDGK